MENNFSSFLRIITNTPLKHLLREKMTSADLALRLYHSSVYVGSWELTSEVFFSFHTFFWLTAPIHFQHCPFSDTQIADECQCVISLTIIILDQL